MLPGDLVWIADRSELGTIRDEIVPRLYEETPSDTFRRNRRDIIHFPTEDVSPTTPDSHEPDSEMTSDDQSQSEGGFPSPPTHSLRTNSQVGRISQ